MRFEFQVGSFQDNVRHLPLAESDAREIKYCTKGIDNTERINIFGSCFDISSLCHRTTKVTNLSSVRVSQ